MTDEQQDTEQQQSGDDGEQLDAEQLDTEQQDELDTEQQDELDGEQQDGEQFPRAYVEQLRRKQQTYRHRAQVAEQRGEQLARELYRSRVAELGMLADPDDMAYDAELLMNADELRAGVTELVRSKPHLAARRVRGNIGQHEQPAGDPGASLGGIMRRNA